MLSNYILYVNINVSLVENKYHFVGSLKLGGNGLRIGVDWTFEKRHLTFAQMPDRTADVEFSTSCTTIAKYTVAVVVWSIVVLCILGQSPPSILYQIYL